MCYKSEKQIKNAEKLQKKFYEENTPLFIQKFFIDIDSKLGAINYWSALRDLFIWLMENKIIRKNEISELTPDDFCNIDPQDIKLYLIYKEQNGMLKSTLNTRKNIFSSFWEYMVNTNLCPIEKNIIKNVKYKKKNFNNNVVKKMPNELQLQEMKENIMKKKEEFVRIRNLCIIEILMGTGMRVSELAGLDIVDLFIKEKDYHFIGEKLPCIKIIGKGAYSKDEFRIIYLTGNAVKSLKEWIDYRKTINNIIDEDALFINKNGKRLNEYNIQSIFKTYGNGITPHMVRHWYATVISNTGNLAFVQQQFGHVSTDVTIKNYVDGSYKMKEILENM